MTSRSSLQPYWKKSTYRRKRQINDYFSPELRLVQTHCSDLIQGYLEKVIEDKLAKGGKDELYREDRELWWWTRKMNAWFMELRRIRMLRLMEEERNRPPPMPIPDPYIRAEIEEKDRLLFFTKPLSNFTYCLPQTGLDPLPIHKNGVCLAMFHK